jgi:hypothetical protein
MLMGKGLKTMRNKVPGGRGANSAAFLKKKKKNRRNKRKQSDFEIERQNAVEIKGKCSASGRSVGVHFPASKAAHKFGDTQTGNREEPEGMAAFVEFDRSVSGEKHRPERMAAMMTRVIVAILRMRVEWRERTVVRRFAAHSRRTATWPIRTAESESLSSVVKSDFKKRKTRIRPRMCVIELADLFVMKRFTKATNSEYFESEM